MAIQRDKVIANAEKLVAKGKIEPAIKEYERLLDDNPNDVNTLNRIGDLWVRINRNDEAVKTYGRIADFYAKDGFFLKAIAIYKKINKLDPSKLDVYGKLADLYAKQGLAMEAKSQYQVLADYYLKHGDPNSALGIYRKISELDPNSINVHVKLADLHSQIGQTAEALKEYDRVGRMLLKRGMLDEAVQVFKKALKIDAKNVELVESLITALLEAKEYDNAVKIVETALETNRNNPKLLGLWAKIQLARGDANSARSTLERALAADPNEVSVRETLADLYLKQNNTDKALEMIIPSVERALGRGERAAAVEMLNRVLRVNPKHTPTLERLVATYVRLNEETNILASMNQLAEAHIANKNFAAASNALEKLIDREPQNAQHRNKLTFVKTQMGGAAAPQPISPRAAEPAAPPPIMEIEEPLPTIDVAEEVPEIGGGIDFDSTPIELDMSLDNATGPVAAMSAPPPASMLEMETEVAFESGEGDDLDFITEHLTEAEVFAKYGLAEKAAEHLRAVIQRSPKHLPAHDRLFRILLDEGDTENARTAAETYVGLLTETGDSETIDAVKQEFLSRGHSWSAAPSRAAARAAALPEVELEIEEAPQVMAEDAMLINDLEQADEVSFDLDASAAPAETPIELETFESPEVAEPIAEEVAEEVAEEATEIPSGEIAFEQEPLTAADTPFYGVEALDHDDSPVAETSLEIETGVPSFEPEPEPLLEIPQEIEFEQEAAEPVATEPSPEEIAEVDSFIGQGLLADAHDRIEGLIAQFPDSAELLKRQLKIDAALARKATPQPPPPVIPAALKTPAAPKPAPPKAAPPKPEPPKPPTLTKTPVPVLSRDEIESELLSAIPDDDEEFTPTPAPPPPAQPVAPPPQVKTTAAQEENLFAEEEDFFDLAAELESELEEDQEVVSLSEEEQSLEEIFKEFKKGVEQQLDSEDYDTHYNLGIAYKEMGLIDEAIGEFQLASKDPKRAVECASMLGLCFLEKGMPQLAIKWYRKGLEMPEITEEEHVGLLYDLGSAYVEVGDTANAQKAFMEVYGMNTNYRDIVSRIKQLEGAR